MEYKKTRFDDGEQRLLYGHVKGTNLRSGRQPRQVSFWRFFHQEGSGEPRSVGPEYPSKEALLVDMDRYGREFGFA